MTIRSNLHRSACFKRKNTSWKPGPSAARTIFDCSNRSSALHQAVGRAGASQTLEDAAHLLLDQARIVEGEPPSDPAAFAKRLSDVLAGAFEQAPD